MRNFGAPKSERANPKKFTVRGARQSGKVETEEVIQAEETILNSDTIVVAYSKDDISYCKGIVAYVAKRISLYNKGAHTRGIIDAAKSIVKSADPASATMSIFIFEYFQQIRNGMTEGNGTFASSKASAEELECMKAIYWYEQSGSEVAWNKASQIAIWMNREANSENVNLVANSENVNLENVANRQIIENEEPFYKQTWFVALGSLVGVSLVGYIGYTIINK